jgi:hypothetical protein
LSNYLTAQNFWTLSNTGFEDGFCVNDFVFTEATIFYAVGLKNDNPQDQKTAPAVYHSFDNENNRMLINTVIYSSGGLRICPQGDTLFIYFPVNKNEAR